MDAASGRDERGLERGRVSRVPAEGSDSWTISWKPIQRRMLSTNGPHGWSLRRVGFRNVRHESFDRRIFAVVVKHFGTRHVSHFVLWSIGTRRSRRRCAVTQRSRTVRCMGALDGIRVIDVGQLVQAPQAAALLADMGADVIKVELPGFGDQARWLPAGTGVLDSGFFVGCNRGKRSVCLDLRKPSGRDAFLRLADTADVVVSNFKPNTLDAWGLGYEVLAARNPRVIYGTGSTYGPIGADAELEGADLAGQAAGGLISTTGRDGTEPTPVGATIADHVSSQHFAAGLLAALFVRERTGKGQRVDVSLVGGQIWAQASEFTAYFLSGEVPGRSNRGHSLINGSYGILPTGNGWVALVGVPAPARTPFCEAIGRPDLFDDPRFASPLLSPEAKQQLFDELGPIFRTKTTEEWVQILRASGTRVAPIRGYDEIAADPQTWENGYFVKGVHPTHGEVTCVGTPLRMSETPLVAGIVAPELGQHTEEVLLEIGFTWEQIARLSEDE